MPLQKNDTFLTLPPETFDNFLSLELFDNFFATFNLKQLFFVQKLIFLTQNLKKKFFFAKIINI